jgi:hypothetical protein
MKITIESTSRLIEIQTLQGRVPARIWEGQTDRGIRVACMITRISVRDDEDRAQFDADLEKHREPSAEAMAFPLRLLI